MMKSVTHATMGELDSAKEFLSSGPKPPADRSGRPFDHVAAAWSGGVLLLAEGNAEAAIRVLDEAYAQADEHGVRIFVPVIACQRGMTYFELQQIDAAVDKPR